MSISSSMSDDGKILTIAAQGRFDFSSLQPFKAVYENPNIKPKAYIIDLKDTEYLDSSALGMLLSLRDYAGGDNADISVLNCNQDVKKILMITKLNDLFKVN